MKVFVSLPSQKTIVIYTNPDDTIEMIKDRIRLKESYSIENQIILFKGRILMNTNTVKYYEINNDSTLQLLLSFPINVTLIPRIITDSIPQRSDIWARILERKSNNYIFSGSPYQTKENTTSVHRETIKINVLSKELISNIRHRIAKYLNILDHNVKLIHKGIQLFDKFSIESYNIGENSMLHCVYELYLRD